MAHMTPEQWQAYRDVMNEWQEDAFQQPIFWVKEIVTEDRFGEDYNKRSETVEIKGLVQYNYFRSWPITATTDAGELDKESCVVFFNLAYLTELGYTNIKGQFNFQTDYDRFIINGVRYKASGDSQVAQAGDHPLFTFVILKREEVVTGEDRINVDN